MTATRKKQTPKPRYARLTASPKGSLVLTIRQVVSSKREQVDAYTLREIRSDWGRGFSLTKAGGETHHVNLAGESSACDCKGHLQHGRCKHVAALLALIQAGRPELCKCPACGGSGKVDGRDCGPCSGWGDVSADEAGEQGDWFDRMVSDQQDYQDYQEE